MNNHANIREPYLTETNAKLMLDQFAQHNNAATAAAAAAAQQDADEKANAKIEEEKKKASEEFMAKIKDYLKQIGMWLLKINIFFMLIALFLAYRCKGFNILHMLIACSCWFFYIPFRLFGECTKKK
jgi:hypothetical protein